MPMVYYGYQLKSRSSKSWRQIVGGGEYTCSGVHWSSVVPSSRLVVGVTLPGVVFSLICGG